MTTDVVTTVPAALDRAAELIEEHGLARQAYLDGEGRLCAIGAIRTAIWGDARYWAHSADGPEWNIYLSATIVLSSAVDSASVIDWSDAHSQAEVVQGLRAAANQARAEASA